MSSPKGFDGFVTDWLSPIGRWQVLFFLTLMLTGDYNYVQFSQFGFLIPDHHCAQPALESLSWSRDDILNLSIPIKEDPNKPPAVGQRFEPCKEYNLDSIIEAIDNETSLDDALQLRDNLFNLTIRTCANGLSYNHETSKLNNTLGVEFNIACDRRFFIQFSNTVYVLGMLTGSIISGPILYHFGRLRVALILPFFHGLSGIASTFAPEVWSWVVLRYIAATISIILFVCSVVLISEWTTAEQRNGVSILRMSINQMFYRSFLVLCFYLMPSWRSACALYFSGQLFVIAGFFFWLESPRWLLSRGEIDKAESTTFKAISMNGKVLSQEEKETIREQLRTISLSLRNRTESHESVEHSKGVNSQNPRRSSFLSNIGLLLRTPKLRCRLILLTILWFIRGLLLYGLSFNSVRLGGNPFLIALFLILSSLPGTILQYLCFRFFDRKWSMVAVLSLTTLSLSIGFIFMCVGYTGTPVIVTATLGALLVAAFNDMLYIRTPEISPTSVRETVLGLCGGFARVGMFVVVFVERFDETSWPPLPQLIFALAAVIGVVASVFLPAGSGVMQEWHSDMRETKEFLLDKKVEDKDTQELEVL